jgi:hypothetical protein
MGRMIASTVGPQRSHAPPLSPIRGAVQATEEPPRTASRDAKLIDTRGRACPNPDCDNREIPDPAVHALFGYGHHGQAEPIQDLYCRACHSKFSVRRHTPLYRLKTRPATVAQVLHAVAEGLSTRAAARVFYLPEATVRSWLTRAGQHSQALHQRLLHHLPLAHVQLDELRFTA